MNRTNSKCILRGIKSVAREIGKNINEIKKMAANQ